MRLVKKIDYSTDSKEFYRAVDEIEELGYEFFRSKFLTRGFIEVYWHRERMSFLRLTVEFPIEKPGYRMTIEETDDILEFGILATPFCDKQKVQRNPQDICGDFQRIPRFKDKPPCCRFCQYFILKLG